MERLIVDSGVLIALERGHIGREHALVDDADVAIGAITAAELLVAVELAEGTRRQIRARLVEGIFDRVEIVPFDLVIARDHAELLVHTRRTGRPRRAHDLQIAATARATRRTLLTTDARGFADLPGLYYRVIGRRQDAN